MPYKLGTDDLKVEQKRLFREVLLDQVLKSVTEAFATQKSMDAVAQQLKDSLEKSEGGKWFCSVSFSE